MDNLGITGETLCLSITCEKYTTASSRQHMVTTPVHLPSLHVVLFDIWRLVVYYETMSVFFLKKKVCYPKIADLHWNGVLLKKQRPVYYGPPWNRSGHGVG